MFVFRKVCVVVRFDLFLVVVLVMNFLIIGCGIVLLGEIFRLCMLKDGLCLIRYWMIWLENDYLIGVGVKLLLFYGLVVVILVVGFLLF